MALRGQYNLNKTSLGNEYKKDKSTNNWEIYQGRKNKIKQMNESILKT